MTGIDKKQRYFNSRNKATSLPENTLTEKLDKLKAVYGHCHLYSKNYKTTIEEMIDDKSFIEKCTSIGILKPWNETYWFDREKFKEFYDFVQQY